LIADSQDPKDRQKLTYAELYRDSLIVARALRGKFEPDERVAAIAPNIINGY